MLETKVAAFTDASVKNWNGIATTCLMAAAYWMMLALDKTPTQADYLKIGNLDTLLRDIALEGTRVVKPSVADGNVHLPVGAVLVFLTPDLARAGHACIIKSGLTVGGYNQVNWFTTPGTENAYSEHDLATDLMWVDRSLPLTRRRVERSVGDLQYYLYATPQDEALKVMRKRLA